MMFRWLDRLYDRLVNGDYISLGCLDDDCDSCLACDHDCHAAHAPRPSLNA